jgi:hypothetical protein
MGDMNKITPKVLKLLFRLWKSPAFRRNNDINDHALSDKWFRWMHLKQGEGKL